MRPARTKEIGGRLSKLRIGSRALLGAAGSDKVWPRPLQAKAWCNSKGGHLC